jgi:hypothetical protein
MKKIFLFLVFSILIFQSCAEIDPVVSNVCDITEEICYYANLVCENFNKDATDNLNEEKTKSELIAIVNDLKYEAEFTSNNSNLKSSLQNSELKYRLLQIRNELKTLYEQQQKVK